jgi:putative transcriptional regulator
MQRGFIYRLARLMCVVFARSIGLSRPAFADRFGLAVSAVRDWEQGLRRPDPAARVLLMVIGRSPDVVAETVAASRAA